MYSSLINKVHYSITLLREPVSRYSIIIIIIMTVIFEQLSVIYYRLISGWFYPGHNPNSDAFHVRSSSSINMTTITAPKPVSFQQYIEMMEYQNIQTRMLGADSFPYRRVTITEQVTVVCYSNTTISNTIIYVYIVVINSCSSVSVI